MSLGSTIGDLQDKITTREFDLWCQYRNKYGPLDPVRKYDRGFALLSSLLANAHGGKTVPNDFLPYGKDKIEEQDEDQFINQLMATGRARKAR